MFSFSRFSIAAAFAAALIVGTALPGFAGGDGDDAASGPRKGLLFGYSVGASSGDNEHFAWNLAGLYRPYDWGAVEFGYLDLGKEGDGFHASIMPMLPLGDSAASLYLSGGAFVSESDISGADDEAWTYGAGVLWDLPEECIPFTSWLKGGFTWRAIEYKRVDYRGTMREDADVLLTGLLYRFGIQKED